MGCLCNTPTEQQLLDKEVQKPLSQSKKDYNRWDKIRLLIIGLPNTGKTTILQQMDLLQNDPSDDNRIALYKNWIQRVLLFLVDEFKRAVELSGSEKKDLMARYGPHPVDSALYAQQKSQTQHRTDPGDTGTEHKKQSNESPSDTLNDQLSTIRSKHFKNPYPTKNISKIHPRFSHP